MITKVQHAAERVRASSGAKKKWHRPTVAHADIRDVTRGGINMMTDPLDITMMMS